MKALLIASPALAGVPAVHGDDESGSIAGRTRTDLDLLHGVIESPTAHSRSDRLPSMRLRRGRGVSGAR